MSDIAMVRLPVMILCLILVGCSDDEEHAPPHRKNAIILELSSGEKIENPTDDQIREALDRLDVEHDGEGFAVLGRDEMTYLQISGDKKTGFDMEYQEGDVKKHFRAAREDFRLDEVVRACTEYRDGTIAWGDYGNWSRITW